MIDILSPLFFIVIFLTIIMLIVWVEFTQAKLKELSRKFDYLDNNLKLKVRWVIGAVEVENLNKQRELEVESAKNTLGINQSINTFK